MDRYLGFEFWRSSAAALWAQLLLRVQSADFLFQLLAIAASAIVAYWAAPRVNRFIKRLLIGSVSRRWVLALSEVLGSIMMSALWLALLWLSVQAGHDAGLRMTLAVAGVNLLAAWVVIRLLSYVVRNPLWSSVIFFVAWTMAALNILGILGHIEASLGQVGFTYGEIHITALNVVRAILVLSVLLWLMAMLRAFLERRITHAESLTPALQAILIQLLKLALPVVAFLVVLPVMGVSLTALTVFGGALVVGLGLGLQRTAANLVSGLALLTGGSVRPDDVIALKNTVDESSFGRIVSIGVGYVSVRTRSGVEHLIPNENLLTGGVENWSHTNDRKIRLKVPFSVGYDADLHKVIALALEVADRVARVRNRPGPPAW